MIWMKTSEMVFRINPIFYILLPAMICVIACRKKERERETVEQAMNQYDRLILKMDLDSIAWLYAPDGELGRNVRGRDSIRKFLENFRKFKVLSQVSKTNLISIVQDTAVQTGVYQQKVIVFIRDTVTVKGLFTAKWIWTEGSGWHIKHMETQPMK
jgi:SnoaL-like domain